MAHNMNRADSLQPQYLIIIRYSGLHTYNCFVYVNLL